MADRHGITRRHFELLDAYGGKPWLRTTEQQAAKAELDRAYLATEAWAHALRSRVFPSGRVELRKAVIHRGRNFARYNWARIYPRPDAPRQLAYTVGIDQSGEFIIKIDLYQANAATDRAYIELRGKTIADSPFGSVMPAARGLEMTLAELVDWSAAAIASFDPVYDRLAAELGLADAPLRLSDDPALVCAAFGRWRAALLRDAVRRGSVHLLPDVAIVVDERRLPPDRLAIRLGHDPAAREWLVEINEPRLAGDPNPLSGIAIDAGGRRHLVRQRTLNAKPLEASDVTEDEFLLRTEERPLLVVAPKPPRDRAWFHVADLDQDDDAIRRSTAAFTDACALARSDRDRGAEDDGEVTEGGDEAGGTYEIGARPATGTKTVTRLHGLVWLALKELASDAGVAMLKPRHCLGYAVDAELRGEGRDALIEIKTGTGAADLHTGVGQLHVYRRLMRRLTDHSPVLLVPGQPAAVVRDAIERCGIAVHTYELLGDGDEVEVRFGEGLIKACLAGEA